MVKDKEIQVRPYSPTTPTDVLITHISVCAREGPFDHGRDHVGKISPSDKDIPSEEYNYTKVV